MTFSFVVVERKKVGKYSICWSGRRKIKGKHRQRFLHSFTYTTTSVRRVHSVFSLISQALQSTLIFCTHFTNVFKEKKAQGSSFQIPCVDLERELILKGLEFRLLSSAVAWLPPSKPQRLCHPGSKRRPPLLQCPSS